MTRKSIIEMAGFDPVTLHPEHLAVVRPSMEPAKPLHPSGFWLRRSVRRACRQRGGHWWHPADAMIAWFCCQCGTERDGWPKDGT